MTSIKDVAKLANVSISTVSIIINGKQEERKISAETVTKVKQVMKELNYQPNLTAKALRINNNKKTIALFWASDFRSIMLARFLSGLQQEIKKNNYPFDIVIYPYENNCLDKEDTLTKVANYNGAIIANASNKDLQFLATIDPLVPIVLYNRYLDNYSCVCVDDKQISNQLYNAVKNFKNIALIQAPHVFAGMKVRDENLIELLEKDNIKVDCYKVKDNNIKDGLTIGNSIDFNKYQCIVCASDMLALGLLHYCYLNNIKVGKDINIIAIGNGLTNIDQYLNPSLSIVDVPLEKMAQDCINMLNEQFNDNNVNRLFVQPDVYDGDSLIIKGKN